MKKSLMLLAFILPLLTACLGPVRPDPSVVTRTEYVVRQAPADMYQLPPQVTAIDASNASQKDIAKWLVESEDRTNTLERMIQALQVFFNQPVVAPDTQK